MGNTSGQPVGLRSVGAALELLRLLTDAEGPIRLAEAADHLAVAPSTAHRLLTTFVIRGFAMRSPTGHGYRRGPELFRATRRRPGELVLLRDVAHPFLEQVSRETGETAHLAILDGFEVIGIDHVESVQTVIHRHTIGSRGSLHASSAGLALLAHSPEVAEALIAVGLARHHETAADGRSLRLSLEKVRQRGYAVNDRLWHAESAGVAAPILDSNGEAVAALGISGPSSRLNRRERLDRLGRLARRVAGEISTRLPDPAAHPHR